MGLQERKWGRTPGSSPGAGLDLSEQAQCQLPQCPAPHTLATCPSCQRLRRLPLSLDSLHLLPLAHISQSSSTYFAVLGLSSSKEPSPPGPREGGRLEANPGPESLLEVKASCPHHTGHQSWPQGPLPLCTWEGITGNE